MPTIRDTAEAQPTPVARSAVGYSRASRPCVPEVPPLSVSPIRNATTIGALRTVQAKSTMNAVAHRCAGISMR